ncbi:hypothetical protein DM806_04955 [Sphingobium lactosutens]|uniref:JAB domain-containing protein n=1 Tax=Sphingobium lactosutens TaxID=522773 RepID=UPI0015BDEB9B|nr:hypothetical protein [Sphingobium lactosutens]
MVTQPSGGQLHLPQREVQRIPPRLVHHRHNAWTAAVAALFTDLHHERIHFMFHANGEYVGDVRFDGDVDSAPFDISLVLRSALLRSASSIMVAHNHPGGRAIPSRQDCHVTRDVAQACRLVGLRLSDHLVVAGDNLFSFRDNGLL